MQKFLVSTALLLALTASGAALAGSVGRATVGYTSPFDNANAYQEDALRTANQAAGQAQWASAGDQRVQTDSQRASMAPSSPQGDWGQSVPASRDDLGGLE